MRPRSFTLAAAVMIMSVLSFLPSGCINLEQEVKTQTVVVGLPEEEGNANSFQPSVSAGGRYVAFASDALNLVNDEPASARGIYLKDIETGETTRISTDSDGKPGDNDSENPSISADGRYVAFQSVATNLVEGGIAKECVNSGGLDITCSAIFKKDISTGTIARVSTSSTSETARGESIKPSISADGRYVAFSSSASNLVEGDDNDQPDIFIKDTQTGITEMISSDPAGIPGNEVSSFAKISDDGRYVAFSSLASNLVEGDSNGAWDVFVKDTETGAVMLVSAASDGTQGRGASGNASMDISGDGRYVAFESEADNLVDSDVDDNRDIFVKDIQSGAIMKASTDAAGVAGEGDSYAAVAISGDGRYVTFSSNANNLVPGDTINKTDIFRKDITSGAIVLVSVDTPGTGFGNGPAGLVSISADGLLVCLASDASNLVLDDINGKTDIFLKNLDTGEISLVSTSSKPDEA